MLHRKMHYKLSTDEKEQIAKAEREKRRKIRLLQVREISRKNAAAIRNAVRLEKLKQLQKLADNINNEFDESKAQQLEELEENYENSLRNIGRAHINASKPMEDEDRKESCFRKRERPCCSDSFSAKAISRNPTSCSAEGVSCQYKK